MIAHSLSPDLFNSDMFNILTESPTTGKQMVLVASEYRVEAVIEKAFVKELSDFAKKLVLERTNAYKHTEYDPGHKVNYMQTAAADTALKMIYEASRITGLYAFCCFLKRTCQDSMYNIIPGEKSRYRKNWLANYNKLFNFADAIILERKKETAAMNDSKSQITPAEFNAE